MHWWSDERKKPTEHDVNKTIQHIIVYSVYGTGLVKIQTSKKKNIKTTEEIKKHAQVGVAKHTEKKNTALEVKGDKM